MSENCDSEESVQTTRPSRADHSATARLTNDVQRSKIIHETFIIHHQPWVTGQWSKRIGQLCNTLHSCMVEQLENDYYYYYMKLYLS